MLTAKEASEISKSFNRQEYQLKLVLQKIKESAESGCLWAIIILEDLDMIIVDDYILNNLKSLGFAHAITDNYTKLEVYWSGC